MGNKIAAAIFFVLLALVGWREYSYQQAKNGYNKDLEQCKDQLAQILQASITTDTVYIDRTIHVEVPRPYPVISTDTVYDTIKDVSEVITQYRDSVPSKDVTLFYDLKTSGELKYLDLWSKLHQQTITKEHIVYRDVPVEVDKTPKLSIYGGFSSGVKQGGLQAEFAVIYKQVGLSYGHDVTNNDQRVGVVFKFK